MRTFAILSFAVAAFAAPAAFAPVGLANAIVPIAVPATVVANAATSVEAYVDAAVANVNAQSNSIGNDNANDNLVKILSRRVATDDVDAFTHDIYPRGAVVDVLAIVAVFLQALVDLCTQVGVNAKAAIANLNITDNSILNDILNGNKINILKRADVNALAEVVSAVVAVVKALVDAGVSANVIIANIQATCNSIANDIGNGNTINVASRDLVSAIATILVVLKAFVSAVTSLGASISVDVLNIALQNNQILTDVLNGNTINILSGPLI
ncbi:hypothetical protein Clacol_007219 [Clathrus columnatus]|uniref:Uncharacterized protein n=1 Tax=Clathrus columnatus TaxID=1419009 RepID=A0AAV5AH54_9AGAM|nr:hypothetical protein Clacol_007219 [Clathrus columnatus]